MFDMQPPAQFDLSQPRPLPSEQMVEAAWHVRPSGGSFYLTLCGPKPLALALKPPPLPACCPVPSATS